MKWNSQNHGNEMLKLGMLGLVLKLENQFLQTRYCLICFNNLSNEKKLEI